MLIAEGRKQQQTATYQNKKLVLAFIRTVLRFKLHIYSTIFNAANKKRVEERLSKFYINFYSLAMSRKKICGPNVLIPGEMQKNDDTKKREEIDNSSSLAAFRIYSYVSCMQSERGHSFEILTQPKQIAFLCRTANIQILFF